VWSKAEEDAANARARQLWGGFTFQTFRIRYKNSSQNVQGAWSRMGIMVGCIDSNLCTWNKNGTDVEPNKSPDLATAWGIENRCDDSKYAQWLQFVTEDCIPWKP
jgi:hypothetical protein